ncbi:MAG: hypothetical protein KatS3mg012_2247 [Gaiellaceae bacterium]|nr:MAG: hypothetical protein KatS3mg012_2247 [Gaiellaceae bacterium]
MSSEWLEATRRRIDELIDAAQARRDGKTIARAGALLDRLHEVERLVAEVDREIAALAGTDVFAPVSLRAPRPPSFLFLPAVGEEAARHLRKTVQSGVELGRLDAWLPSQAAEIRERAHGELAAWGLRDSGLAGSRGRAPTTWDRIFEGTLALFSTGQYFECAARVIGKGCSDAATNELWGSPEFRWLILLSDVRSVRIPVADVVAGAGFKPSYRVNRQALVPRPEREAGIWRVIEPHLGGVA